MVLIFLSPIDNLCKYPFIKDTSTKMNIQLLIEHSADKKCDFVKYCQKKVPQFRSSTADKSFQI